MREEVDLGSALRGQHAMHGQGGNEGEVNVRCALKGSVHIKLNKRSGSQQRAQQQKKTSVSRKRMTMG